MKLAIIGLKGNARNVLGGARALGDVEVVAISEADPEALKAFVEKDPLLGGVQTYAHWRQLLEHTMPDVCCVADEPGLRAEQIGALLERGVHVVAEKPLATTPADLDRLRTAFAASKSQLTMLLELRHQAKNVRLREIIRRGDIGEVSQVSTQRSYIWGERAEWFRSRERFGGTIPYIGIHSLDIIRWITGLEFTQLAALHGNIGRPEMGRTESQASILAQLSNGASFTARLDYLRPAEAPTKADERLRIVGSKGIVEVNEGDDAITLIAGGKVERIPFGTTEPLFAEFAKFLRGGPVPRITADDCFYATDLVLRAREAADEKKMITLPAMRPVRDVK
ncbi:MAG: Gfo/Idh/MocA family oxidoreductase [Planctomycetia bacterium]|nr:Gfo/Idh/MocA family oxidoreductase [Planctomycetia bacterium]